MTKTQTFHLEPIPATWAHFDCSRLANPAEMAACHNTCECGTVMTSKVGGGLIQGTVIGYRNGPTEAWNWSPVLCRACEVAASIADGY